MRLSVQVAAVGVLAVGVLLFVVLGRDGGGGEPVSSSAGFPSPQFARNCAESIEGGFLRPDSRFDVVVGPLTFHGLREASDLPRDSFAPRRGRYLAIKTVTSVRNDQRVVIAIKGSDRSSASLLYDNARFREDGRYLRSDGVSTVRLTACSRREPASDSRATQFNGGFVVTRASCVRVLVFVNGEHRPREVSIPFGVAKGRCSGAPRR
jgi:hypothetical protein